MPRHFRSWRQGSPARAARSKMPYARNGQGRRLSDRRQRDTLAALVWFSESSGSGAVALCGQCSAVSTGSSGKRRRAASLALVCVGYSTSNTIAKPGQCRSYRQPSFPLTTTVLPRLITSLQIRADPLGCYCICSDIQQSFTCLSKWTFICSHGRGVNWRHAPDIDVAVGCRLHHQVL